MKTSLDHLDWKTQEELKEIAGFVKNHPEMEVEMLILFGSYARGDWVSDRYNEDGIAYSYESDIDLLCVMRSEEKAQHKIFTKQIKRRIKKISDLEKSLNIIYHGIDYLNDQIEDRQYFFADIYDQGIMLYDSGNYELSSPIPQTPKARYRRAVDSYEQWYDRSVGFFRQYEHAVNDNDLAIAMFDLHQTCERLFMTTLLVFTAYKPKTHDLSKLYNQVKREERNFDMFFPIIGEEDKRLFKLLKDAYIDSRYKKNYSVEKRDVERIAMRVEVLKNLTERICLEKIEEYKSELNID